ncbi:MAG: DUF262 domain-containing protein [Candidatus Binatia bacterium]|jgi:hypothetical protein
MSNGKTLIAFQQIGLASVLRQYRLRVPPNQREYSWEDEHVTTLFRDLAKAISDDSPEYFLGTIVTIPRSDEVLELVDGQQRLATTAILLAEIRNYLQTREQLITERITNLFLTDIDPEQRARVAKLQLNLVDNDFFRSMILRTDNRLDLEPTKSSHRLIQTAFKEAAKHIRSILSSFDPKDHGDVLNKWCKFLEHGATVILLRVPSDRNAYKMFETLNARGLATSQWDLVKNYLFGESSDREQEAQSKWAAIRGALDSLDEDDITILFLRHALIAIRGHVKKEDVYEAVQAQVRGPESALAFLTTLETLAMNYAALFNTGHEKWNTYPDAVRDALKTLHLFNVKPLRPLMLAVALRFSPKEAASALNAFITLAVRLLIAGSTRTGSVEIALAEAANAVFGKQAPGTGELVPEITGAAALKKKLTQILPNDQEFRQGFETATVSKPILARYYLRSLERQVKGQMSPWFVPNDDREVITLEHVLPMKPTPAWLSSFTEEEMEADVNRLGNLVLLLAKYNCDLRSDDFETKRAVYENAPYELTKQVATVADWNHAQIVERQKVLAEIAIKTWPL